MNLEGYKAKKESDPAVDEELFKRFEPLRVKVLSAVKPSAESKAREKDRLFSGETQSPTFDYPGLDKIDFEEMEAGLLALRQELKDKPELEKFEQAYAWTVNEYLARLRMLKEAKLAKEDSENEELHYKRFKRYSEFIYGAPEPEIFQSVLGLLKNKLQNLTEVSNQAAFKRLEALAATGSKPDERAFPPIPEDGQELITSAEAAKEYLEAALEEMGIDDWTVEIDESGERRTFAAPQNLKKIFVPNDENLQARSGVRKFTLNMLRGLIVHEAGTHALQAYNGARSRLKLLTLGLDRAEKGEEGVATYREQQETGSKDYAGFSPYLIAGLVYGLDGGQKRNFGDVFKIMTDYHEVIGKNDQAKAKEKAFNACLRLFRGTACHMPGITFNKDILYRQGNRETYQLFDGEHGTKIDFNVGRFDPSNPRHLMVLIEYGIQDEDLKALVAELE